MLKQEKGKTTNSLRIQQVGSMPKGGQMTQEHGNQQAATNQNLFKNQ